VVLKFEYLLFITIYFDALFAFQLDTALKVELIIWHFARFLSASGKFLFANSVLKLLNILNV